MTEADTMPLVIGTSVGKYSTKQILPFPRMKVGFRLHLIRTVSYN